MKKKYLILLIVTGVIISCFGCSNISSANNKGKIVSTTKIKSATTENITTTKNYSKKISELTENEFTMIPEQSFNEDFENFGKVKFVTGYHKYNNIMPKLDFYLVDSNDEILYKFPNYYGNDWIFYEIEAISFKDVNGDGFKDVIVIADYILGHGENAATPFPVADVYFQKGKRFVSFPNLAEENYTLHQNKNIDMVINFYKDKDVNLN